jgi:phage-related protein
MKILFTNIHQQTTWINDDENYSLIAISGLQPPKATIQLGSLPGVDGSMHLHSKVEQRTINLTLQILGDGESNRRKLAQIFKIKQMGTLRLELSNQKVRIDAIVESVEVLPMSWPMRALITLICPQPYFEDEQSIQLELASIDQLFQFPLSLNQEGQAIGNLSPSTAINAYNSGDMDIGHP